MNNVCTEHERKALELLEEYADNGRATGCGMVRWIEPNDPKFRISWGTVEKVKLDWWGDHTGQHCRISVRGDRDGWHYDDILLRDESEEDQEAVVNLLCDWSADFQRYRPENIRGVLSAMADYAMGCESEEELQEYFLEMADTGLFNDAIGHVTRVDEDSSVVVTTEY